METPMETSLVHGRCMHDSSLGYSSLTDIMALNMVCTGGVATETPLKRVDLPERSSNPHSAGHTATLQLALDSGLVGALSFVIHAPAGRWVACNRNGSREDFFFSLAPVSS